MDAYLQFFDPVSFMLHLLIRFLAILLVFFNAYSPFTTLDLESVLSVCDMNYVKYKSSSSEPDKRVICTPQPKERRIVQCRKRIHHF